MIYIAKDGKKITGQGAYQRGRLYDKSLGTDKNKFEVINTAPGGPRHEHERKAHGEVKSVTVNRDGTTRVTHADGHSWGERHPDLARANEVTRDYFGVPSFPASEHFRRTRSHPVGEGEGKRLQHEDGREEEE